MAVDLKLVLGIGGTCGDRGRMLEKVTLGGTIQGCIASLLPEADSKVLDGIQETDQSNS